MWEVWHTWGVNGVPIGKGQEMQRVTWTVMYRKSGDSLYRWWTTVEYPELAEKIADRLSSRHDWGVRVVANLPGSKHYPQGPARMDCLERRER